MGGLEFSQARATLLVLFSYLAGHLVATFFIPTLLCGKIYLRTKSLESLINVNLTDTIEIPNDKIDIRDEVYGRMSDSIRYNLARTTYFFSLFSTVFVTCSMINCFIHRRHLMVWAVFAPKLIFDFAHVMIIDVFFIINIVAIHCFTSKWEKYTHRLKQS